MTNRKTIYLDDAIKAVRKLPNAGIQWLVNAESVFKVLEALPSIEPEIIRCKDCKHRGIVNVCPHAGYMVVGKKTNRGTDTISASYNYGTQVVTYCNAKDDDFCSRGERKDDD